MAKDFDLPPLESTDSYSFDPMDWFDSTAQHMEGGLRQAQQQTQTVRQQATQTLAQQHQQRLGEHGLFRQALQQQEGIEAESVERQRRQ
eukprot:2264091-Amphidinium_carterae.1